MVRAKLVNAVDGGLDGFGSRRQRSVLDEDAFTTSSSVPLTPTPEHDVPFMSSVCHGKPSTRCPVFAVIRPVCAEGNTTEVDSIC